MSRDQLRPLFRKAPKWLLHSLQVACWPACMAWLSFRVGPREAHRAWKGEIHRIQTLED